MSLRLKVVAEMGLYGFAVGILTMLAILAQNAQ